MSKPFTSEGTISAEPPLWSIGLAVAIILGAPLILYSLAPTGPIREGDTVFSDGQQRVQLAMPTTDPKLQRGDTCLLDPNSPLVVVHVQNDEADGSIVARLQGDPSTEWPFCALHADVLLKMHQVFQKPALFTEARTVLRGFLGR